SPSGRGRNLKNMSFHKPQSGVALLYAVLMLGTVSLISLVIASLTLRNLKISRDVGNNMLAYYAAESGVEKALYDVYVGGVTSGTANVNLKEIVAGRWEYTIKTSFDCSDPFIQEGALSADQTLAFDNLGGPTRLRIRWDDDDNNATNNTELVEVTWVGWDDNLSNFALDPENYEPLNQTVFKNLFSYSSSEQNWQGTVKANNLVRIKPLKQAIKGLKVCFDNVDIEDKVRVDAKGIFHDYQKAIESIYSSTTLSPSGYFDYAIFSEQNIRK
ncbi:MAG: hypothetical protein Q8N68_02640, partial [bacterium]|nr:hypothetical protein [bacterium]